MGCRLFGGAFLVDENGGKHQDFVVIYGILVATISGISGPNMGDFTKNHSAIKQAENRCWKHPEILG